MIPQFHPAAAAELEEALKSSLGYGRTVALRLRLETARVLQLLCDTPNIGEPLTAVYRRFPLRGFPFSLVYRVDDDLLRIVAFAHRRRRPGYWSRRK